MKFPLKIGKPLNFDNFVIYIHDANNEYIGYIMCPQKEDVVCLADVLKEWSKSEKERLDILKKYNLTE